MPDADEWIRVSDLASLVGKPEVRLMLSRGRQRLVSMTYTDRVTRQPGFPAPAIRYPRDQDRRNAYTRVRLWWPADVEDFCRRTIPGWDDLPPAPMD